MKRETTKGFADPMSMIIGNLPSLRSNMSRTKQFLTSTAIALASLAMAFQAEAAPVAYLSTGATCLANTPANTSASFTAVGPPVTMSVCVTSIAGDFGYCGASLKLRTSNAGENGAFTITNRVLGPNFPDQNSVPPPNFAPPGIPIVFTPTATDFGGTSNTFVPTPTPSTQLVATFTLSPQAAAPTPVHRRQNATSHAPARRRQQRY